MPGLPFARRADASEQSAVPYRSLNRPTTPAGDLAGDESGKPAATCQAATAEEDRGTSMPESQSELSSAADRKSVKNAVESSEGQAGPAIDSNNQGVDAGPILQPKLLLHNVKCGVSVCWWGDRQYFPFSCVSTINGNVVQI